MNPDPKNMPQEIMPQRRIGSPTKPQFSPSGLVAYIKDLRKTGTNYKVLIRDLPGSRAAFLAYDHAELAVMYLGLALEELNEANPGAAPNPYPRSMDSSDPAIDPPAPEVAANPANCTSPAVNLPGWYQRLIVEFADVGGKCDGLSAFMGSPEFLQIPLADRLLLEAQSGAMVEYRRILGARISTQEGRWLEEHMKRVHGVVPPNEQINLAGVEGLAPAAKAVEVVEQSEVANTEQSLPPLAVIEH